jgi:hypothetical protein
MRAARTAGYNPARSPVAVPMNGAGSTAPRLDNWCPLSDRGDDGHAQAGADQASEREVSQ